MTAYFDLMASRVRVARIRASDETVGVSEALAEIDVDIARDASVAAEMPGFPTDLRDSVHRAILRGSLEGQPLSMPHAAPEIADDIDYAFRLGELVEDLHDIFHEVGRRSVIGFTDDPTYPLRALWASAQDRRACLASEADPWELWLGDDGQPLLARRSASPADHRRVEGWRSVEISPESAVNLARSLLGRAPLSVEKAGTLPIAARVLGSSWLLEEEGR